MQQRGFVAAHSALQLQCKLHCATALCMQVALCKLHCATAGGGEVKINGCVAGRFKKRGLSMEDFGG